MEKITLTDEAILKVNSPKSRCSGPYAVVHKEQNWAIVALDWDGTPSLAIRWFVGKLGNPTSHEHPTWFVIPWRLHNAILNDLPLNDSFKEKINRFLADEIDGNELKEKFTNAVSTL